MILLARMQTDKGYILFTVPLKGDSMELHTVSNYPWKIF